MNSKSPRMIILLVFLLTKMMLIAKLESRPIHSNETSLPVDVQRLFLNFVISFTLTHDKLNEEEEKILHTILQFLER